MDAVSSSSAHPDLLVIAKCKYGHTSKKILFNSSRACSFTLLQSRVDRAFGLRRDSYALQYTDNDSEVVPVEDDRDLAEALQYFYTPVPDPEVDSLSVSSSAARVVTVLLDVIPDCASLTLTSETRYSSPGHQTPQTPVTSASCHRSFLHGEAAPARNNDDEGIGHAWEAEALASFVPEPSADNRLHDWIRQQSTPSFDAVLEMCHSIPASQPSLTIAPSSEGQPHASRRPTRAFRELWADSLCVLCRLSSAGEMTMYSAPSHPHPLEESHDPKVEQRRPTPAFLEYRRPFYSRMHVRSGVARSVANTMHAIW